ncbi:hypothetical protein EV181_002431, partial [Coemansia sp. RSA 532]
FLCNGITFDTSFMDTLDPVFRHKIVDVRSRQIRVQPTMQINHPELPWIFAAGDVCNTAGEKQAYRADSQGAHVARCMGRMAHAWAQGTSRWFDVPLKQWHDPAQFMAVAMGPNAGVTDTPWIVLGDLPTRIMKSRELFLARRYKEFNLEFPGTKQKSRSSSASSSTTNISRVTGTAPHAPMYAQNQRRPMRNVVATDLNHKSYGLSKAVAKMAIAAAGSLDNKLDSDRVSLSRPMMRRAPSHNSAYPYSGFYETEQHSETESVQSDEYSSEEEEVGDLNGPARLYAQTAPSNRHTSSSSTTTSSHSMLKSTVSASASVSSASISTSTSGSSASSITPTLLHGPVIPRQQKDRRALGCSAFFQSHVVIAEDADDSAYVAPQKPKAILSHPLLGNKHSGSTATIHLQQYDYFGIIASTKSMGTELNADIKERICQAAYALDARHAPDHTHPLPRHFATSCIALTHTSSSWRHTALRYAWRTLYIDDTLSNSISSIRTARGFYTRKLWIHVQFRTLTTHYRRYASTHENTRVQPFCDIALWPQLDDVEIVYAHKCAFPGLAAYLEPRMGRVRRLTVSGRVPIDMRRSVVLLQSPNIEEIHFRAVPREDDSVSSISSHNDPVLSLSLAPSVSALTMTTLVDIRIVRSVLAKARGQLKRLELIGMTSEQLATVGVFCQYNAQPSARVWTQLCALTVRLAVNNDESLVCVHLAATEFPQLEALAIVDSPGSKAMPEHPIRMSYDNNGHV